MTTDTCKRELAIEVPAEEAERELKTVTAQYARVARIPGFRPGHAPSSLVLRRFRKDIRNDVVQSLLPKFFDHVVKERNWSVVGQPRFEELKFDEAQPLRCKAVFEVYPEFELTSYQGLEVEEDLVQVTDADVDQTLANLRQRAATFEVVQDRSAQEGDFVTVNYRSPAADVPEARDAVVELGGKGTVLGPVIGALIFTFLPEYLRFAKDLRLPIFGFILILGIVFLPRGIITLPRLITSRWGEKR